MVTTCIGLGKHDPYTTVRPVCELPSVVTKGYASDSHVAPVMHPGLGAEEVYPRHARRLRVDHVDLQESRRHVVDRAVDPLRVGEKTQLPRLSEGKIRGEDEEKKTRG